MNNIIDNINYLSSPQLNTALATVVYKSKAKPVFEHKSYRLVRVSPLIGRIFDEYVRPIFIQETKPFHHPSQYGFTAGISYPMGALQRHETEKYCLYTKKTYFGCSLDGISAFDVVNREIQSCELYLSGEKGKNIGKQADMNIKTL